MRENIDISPLYTGNKCNKRNNAMFSNAYMIKQSVTNSQMLHLRNGVNLLILL